MEYGTYKDQGIGPDGNSEDFGRYVTVYRNVNGEWKAYSDIGTSTKPAEPLVPNDSKLNQLELANQFIGKWQSVVGKDTVDIIEYKRFGNALVCRCNRIIKGMETPVFVLDVGYAAGSNQLKAFILFSSGDYLTANCYFKTEKILTGVYLPDFNKDIIISRFEDEFISPNELAGRVYDKDGAIIEEVKWTKIK